MLASAQEVDLVLKLIFLTEHAHALRRLWYLLPVAMASSCLILLFVRPLFGRFVKPDSMLTLSYSSHTSYPTGSPSCPPPSD